MTKLIKKERAIQEKLDKVETMFLFLQSKQRKTPYFNRKINTLTLSTAFIPF